MDEELRKEEVELVDKLEDEVDTLDREFELVKDEEADESLRQKQQKVEEILGEVHEQLDFLRKTAEDGFEK